MEQTAMPGSILITADVLLLVEGYVQVTSLGPVAVMGLSAPVEVSELVGAGPVRSRLQAAAARGLTRFVGRQPELETLRHTLDRALEPILSAILALLDVPVEDAAWQALDPLQRRRHTLEAVKRPLP